MSLHFTQKPNFTAGFLRFYRLFFVFRIFSSFFRIFLKSISSFALRKFPQQIVCSRFFCVHILAVCRSFLDFPENFPIQLIFSIFLIDWKRTKESFAQSFCVLASVKLSQPTVNTQIFSLVHRESLFASNKFHCANKTSKDVGEYLSREIVENLIYFRRMAWHRKRGCIALVYTRSWSFWQSDRFDFFMSRSVGKTI